MKTFSSTSAARDFLKRGSCVTIGNFDGVHMGHRALLADTIKVAEDKKLKSVVLSFEPHPVRFLSPKAAPPLINTRAQKIELIKKLGIDALILQKFDARFAAVSPRAFIEKKLVHDLHARHVFVGYDFTFGSKRQGNTDILTKIGDENKVAVHVIPARLLEKTLVSSTTIRHCIAQGDMQTACTLLGRPFFIDGTVVHGEKRGGELGIHTANINPDNEIIPLDGVYATFVFFAGKLYESVTNIGFNPTFGNENRRIETHIFGFDRKIYNKKLRLLFVERLRGEKKFKNPQELVAQIRKDIVMTRDILKKGLCGTS